MKTEELRADVLNQAKVLVSVIEDRYPNFTDGQLQLMRDHINWLWAIIDRRRETRVSK